MKKLEITAEKIKAGAEKCPKAKKVLKEIFPEVFEDDKYFELNKLETNGYCNRVNYNIFTYKSCKNIGLDESFIQIRKEGKFKNIALYLDNNYNWKIINRNNVKSNIKFIK